MVIARRKTFVASHAYVFVTHARDVIFCLVEGIHADAFCVLVDLVKLFCLVFAALVGAIYSV